MVESSQDKVWNPKVQCRKCKTVIHSTYDGEFVQCKCSAIFADQTKYYSRYGGNPEDFNWDYEQD